MQIENKKPKNILISTEIDGKSASDTIKSIFDINFDDDLNADTYSKFVREPINLYINSFGGSMYNGLAIVDAIRGSTTPVNTYCIGSAMSMGFWIYLAGEKRFAGKYATFMYHEVSDSFWGKLTGAKLHIEEAERIQNLYDSFVRERTNILQSNLNEYRERKSEWYITAEDAKKLGICHEVF